MPSGSLHTPPPLAHMNSYRPPSSFSRDETISLLKGPREQVRDTKHASSNDFDPASKRRQRGREQQTARESPKTRDRQQPSTPSSSGTFALQNHPQHILHDPPALVSAHQAEVRTQQVQQQPSAVSRSLPSGTTSTRAPGQSLPVQEGADDEGPSGDKDNEPLLRAEFPPRADRTPEIGGARYDSFRRSSHQSISIPRKPPADAMSMQSSPSHEPTPTPTKGQTRKLVKRRTLYIANPSPASSSEETGGDKYAPHSIYHITPGLYNERRAVHEEAVNDVGVGTKNGGPSRDNDEPLLNQWQIFAQKNNQSVMSNSDSACTPAPVPFQGVFSPWAHWHTQRILGRTGDAMSSSSHEPVPLPRAPAISVRKVQAQARGGSRLRRNPSPRVESPQPRDTSPEPSSSEGEGNYGTPSANLVAPRMLLEERMLPRNSSPKPASFVEERGGGNYAMPAAYHINTDRGYDKLRAGAVMPINEDSDDEADFALEEDADVNNEKSVMLSITDTCCCAWDRRLYNLAC